MEEPTVVEINGTEYYAPSDHIDDLIVVDGKLVNVSGSTIYLYHDFKTYQDNSSGYPRITCPSNTYAYIQNSYQSTSSTLTVSSYEVLNRSFDGLFLLGCLVVGILSMILFKRS